MRLTGSGLQPAAPARQLLDLLPEPSSRVLAWLGAGASALVVVGGGAVGPVHGAHIPTHWFGLLAPAPKGSWPAALELIGVGGLVTIWLLAMRSVGRGTLDTRAMWRIAAAWAAPFIVGPPLLSSDIFSYAAQGVLQLRDLNPYQVGPVALGRSAAVLAVDPRWRTAVSPYGPLVTLIEHAVAWVTRGDVPVILLLLRLLAVAAVAATGVLAQRLAPPRLRASALALTVLNPLVLLQAIAAAHLEALMGALLLGSLVAAVSSRRLLAIILSCLAAAVKIPAIVLSAALVLWPGEDPRRRASGGQIAIGAGVVAGTWLLLSRLVPDGWGWIGGLLTPGRISTPLAPTQLLTTDVESALHAVGLTAPAFVPSACRAVGLLIAGLLVLYLLCTAERRSLPATAGLSLLAIGLLGPVLYPTYLLWGVVCLAPEVMGAGRAWLVGLCAGASMMNLPGMHPTVVLGVGLGAMLVVGVALAVLLVRDPRRRGDAFDVVSRSLPMSVLFGPRLARELAAEERRWSADRVPCLR